MRRTLVLGFLCLSAALHAQAPNPAHTALYRAKQLPHEAGFRVFIVPDMEGMGSAVDIREVIAGNEGERYKTLTSVGLLGSLPRPAHPGGQRDHSRRPPGGRPELRGE